MINEVTDYCAQVAGGDAIVDDALDQTRNRQVGRYHSQDAGQGGRGLNAVRPEKASKAQEKPHDASLSSSP